MMVAHWADPITGTRQGPAHLLERHRPAVDLQQCAADGRQRRCQLRCGGRPRCTCYRSRPAAATQANGRSIRAWAINRTVQAHRRCGRTSVCGAGDGPAADLHDGPAPRLADRAAAACLPRGKADHVADDAAHDSRRARATHRKRARARASEGLCRGARQHAAAPSSSFASSGEPAIWRASGEPDRSVRASRPRAGVPDEVCRRGRLEVLLHSSPDFQGKILVIYRGHQHGGPAHRRTPRTRPQRAPAWTTTRPSRGAELRAVCDAPSEKIGALVRQWRLTEAQHLRAVIVVSRPWMGGNRWRVGGLDAELEAAGLSHEATPLQALLPLGLARQAEALPRLPPTELWQLRACGKAEAPRDLGHQRLEGHDDRQHAESGDAGPLDAKTQHPALARDALLGLVRVHAQGRRHLQRLLESSVRRAADARHARGAHRHSAQYVCIPG
mmetsp:Transcript_82039/g.265817  ORF Transcript_82039/g.265817 Transcript_82039/m.265817 type:complete len:443 (+) Transcript_82039:3-1331(+)